MATDAALIDQAHAFFNQGNALFEQGRLEEAAESFRAGVRINRILTGAYNNQGIAQAGQGQLDEASQSFRAALRINPNHVEARYNLGNALKDQGQAAEAERCYRQVLRITPHHADAHNNLGNTLRDQERLDEAIDSFRQALRINPNLAIAHNNLGLACKDQENFDEAIACFRKALHLDPAHADVHYNLGCALRELGQLNEAVACFRQALRIAPHHANALDTLGNSLYELGLIAEAEECFRQALAIDPDFRLARLNRRLQRLRHGDFEGSWEGFDTDAVLSNTAHRHGHRPHWNGSNLEGKTILVHAVKADKGLGDTIQFARYFPMIKQRGGRVIFECQPVLAELLTGFPGVDQLVHFGKFIPSFDFQIPLFHLFTIFKTTLASIPANVPYLYAKPEKIDYWRKTFSREPEATAIASGSPLNIGIAWQGSMNQKDERRSLPLAHFERLGRSLPLAHFEKLARLENIKLVSLQVGTGARQLAEVSFPVMDLGSRFDTSSMEDLAATLVNLDLVITVDTAVAHLAGALGVPVWVALPLYPCWRWLLHREDSPWYPTMRLFRQKRWGDWDDVIARIAAALATFSPGSTNRG